MLRRLLDVFRLRMRYDRESGLVEREVTITSEIVGTQQDAASGVAETGVRGGLRYPLRDPPRTGSSPHLTQRPPNHPIPLNDFVTACYRVTRYDHTSSPIGQRADMVRRRPDCFSIDASCGIQTGRSGVGSGGRFTRDGR